MFPFDKEKRVRKPALTGLFDGMLQEFEKEMGRMTAMSERQEGRSLVWGYSAYTGPDGRTHVNEYGNTPGLQGQPAPRLGAAACGPECAHAEADGAIEPYYDVLDQKGAIRIIVEMPGVEKERIRVQSNGRHVDVKADSEMHSYAARIPVPELVEAKPRKAQYKNGVLEITFAKEESPTDVEVE